MNDLGTASEAHVLLPLFRNGCKMLGLPSFFGEQILVHLAASFAVPNLNLSCTTSLGHFTTGHAHVIFATPRGVYSHQTFS